MEKLYKLIVLGPALDACQYLAAPLQNRLCWSSPVQVCQEHRCRLEAFCGIGVEISVDIPS